MGILVGLILLGMFVYFCWRVWDKWLSWHIDPLPLLGIIIAAVGVIGLCCVFPWVILVVVILTAPAVFWW